jgi:twitching motility protein PilI
MSDLKAFAILTALAQRSQAVAVDLPARENAQTHWNGLGFSLLGQRFVTPMSEVAELMRLPTVTRLPGVKPFVIGVANVRGRLMAILDLAMFFGTSSALPRGLRRVLLSSCRRCLAGDESQNPGSRSRSREAGKPGLSPFRLA